MPASPSCRKRCTQLADAFLAKGQEFGAFIKMGRTQLQDAVPMTLGQEFTAFAHTILEDVDRLGEAQKLHPRDQHGGDGDRDGHKCTGGICGGGAATSCRG